MFATHRQFDLSTGVKSASIAVVNECTSIVVLYHKTMVVSAKRQNRRGKKYLTVTLRNGGWDTISTRHVINQALSELGVVRSLYRKKGCTFVSDAEGKELCPFVSGMKIKVVLE